MPKAPTSDRATLLEAYPSLIRDLAEALCEIIHSTVDDLRERVNHGWRSVNFHDDEGGYLFGIFPFEDRVQLVFERGHRLSDPDGIFAETDTRQVRVVVLRPGGKMPEEPLRKMLLSALHEARTRRAFATQRRRPRRDRGSP